MDLPRNAFKHAIRAGKQQIGLWVSLADPYCTEIVAGSGFDWILIDGEHSPNDPITVLAQLQAAAPYPVTPIVRAAWNDTVLVKRYLDVGAQTCSPPSRTRLPASRRAASPRASSRPTKPPRAATSSGARPSPPSASTSPSSPANPKNSPRNSRNKSCQVRLKKWCQVRLFLFDGVERQLVVRSNAAPAVNSSPTSAYF